MKKLGDYINDHAWTHWVIAFAFFGVLNLIIDVVYPAIHGGGECVDALIDWMTGAK